VSRWPETIIERFLNYVEKTATCWIWHGPDSNGRGVFGVGDKLDYAARVSYKLFVGEIPAGLDVCHSCDNGSFPTCVNPDHLFPGTRKQNMEDCVAKNRQHKGEDVPTSKLNPEIVTFIRKSNLPHSHLARAFGVSSRCIRKIRNIETWKHISLV
jgi:hypothetical protein